MKSTINISISGVAFTLESDAYDALNGYMNQIERAYKSESASSEIISDIEARISELVLSWQSEHATIVTRECIDAIILQMGVPEEPSIAAQPITDATENERIMVSKRLYRNAQGSRLGGVLNGIASYFNIDVTLLRIAVLAIFVACIFFGNHQGVTLPIIIISYVGMWMIVPMAKNARQKMEMHGQPITAETISSNIKEELNYIAPNDKNEKTASILTNLLYAIGRVIRFVFLFFAIIVGVVVFASIISVIAVGCAILFEGQETVRIFIDTDPVWATLLASACALIPLLLIMYAIIKMFFSLRWNSGILISLFALWIVSWALGTYTFATNIYSYNRTTSTNDNKFHKLTSDTLKVMPIGHTYIGGFDWKAGVIRDRVDFDIEENDELSKSNIKIEIRRRSAGGTLDEAIINCNEIDFNYTLTGDTLTFPNVLTYDGAGAKYRGQSVRIRIKVAPNTNIVIPEDFYNRNRRHIFDDDYEIDTHINNDNNVYIKAKKHSDNDNNSASKSVSSEKIETDSTKANESNSTKVEVVSIKDGKIVTTKK